MHQVQVCWDEEQAGGGHPFQGDWSRFMVADFSPLLHHVSIRIGAEAKNRFKSVSRVLEPDANQLATRVLRGSSQIFKQQIAGGVSIAVSHLKRGFPNITVAG